jgi:hypothetical protein
MLIRIEAADDVPLVNSAYRRSSMKRLTVLVAFAALLTSGCDQPASTDKPTPAAETPASPVDRPTTAETPSQPAETPAAVPAPTAPAAPVDTAKKADKKPNPCKADRKALCPGIKDRKDVLACFKQNEGKLSEACKASVKLD